ncbi:MAG TPA: hypothetical protein VIY96_11740 [Thermoanaerobaculia bacterium]
MLISLAPTPTPAPVREHFVVTAERVPVTNRTGEEVDVFIEWGF